MAQGLIKILMVGFTMSLCLGCATNSTQKQIDELSQALIEKDEELKKCNERLDEQEISLGEKDLEINELRRELEGFGVFER